ncbi:MAG: hypothetical protein JSV56_08390, partial [Methanomassiliicoccales archaeon]
YALAVYLTNLIIVFVNLSHGFGIPFAGDDRVIGLGDFLVTGSARRNPGKLVVLSGAEGVCVGVLGGGMAICGRWG